VMRTAYSYSDWLFLLPQNKESIEVLGGDRRMQMNETKKHLLNSLHAEPGVFSELYISSPMGEGIARNLFDEMKL